MVLKNKKYFYCVLILLINFKVYFSQNVIHDLNHRKINLDSISKIYELKKQAFISGIPKENSRYVKNLVKDYQIKIDNLKELIATDNLFINDSINCYLKKIIDKVKETSPFIASDFSVFINGTTNPNAASWGNSILVFNAGLITKYKNIEELAFVVCHEMAHDYLNHSVKKTIRNQQIIKKEDFKDKFKYAKRSRYGRAKALKEVNEEFLIKTNVFSREDEFQADSLGYVLFKNANYFGNNAIESLRILKEVDDKFFDQPLNIKKEFDFSNYPFQNEWLNFENLEVGIFKNKIIENDSLKTHPDCDERIKRLVDCFKVDTLSLNRIANTYSTDKLIKNSYYENLKFCYNNENYLFSLYFALHLKQDDKTNDYLNMIVCHSLLQIGNSLKRHEFSYYVPLPNIEYDKDLNYLISFLNNLSFSDYKELTKQFQVSNIDNSKKTYNNGLTCIFVESFGLTDGEIKEKISTFKLNYKK